MINDFTSAEWRKNFLTHEFANPSGVHEPPGTATKMVYGERRGRITLLFSPKADSLPPAPLKQLGPPSSYFGRDGQRTGFSPCRRRVATGRSLVFCGLWWAPEKRAGRRSRDQVFPEDLVPRRRARPGNETAGCSRATARSATRRGLARSLIHIAAGIYRQVLPGRCRSS